MASPAHPRPGATPSELQDELLEEIFLRLPTAADLARASTACPTFRRVIAGHPFLRRFRTLHPPPLLGVISVTFLPAQPPHPSAAAARAVATAAGVDFRCSFLPSAEQLSQRDFRDGRALLSGLVPEGSTSSRYGYKRRDFATALTTLAVCDPVHRGYLLLPAIPDELAALVHQPDIVDFVPFLAPPGEGEEVSGPQGFCWAVYQTNKLLMLDTRVMEFSAVDLPPAGRTMPAIAFVEAEEGRIGMFTAVGRTLCYTKLQNDGDGGANRWQPVAVVTLPLGYRYTIVNVAGGYLLLQGIPEDTHSAPLLAERQDYDCFSLNLQTLQLERFCTCNHMILSADLYVGFPPSLTPPTI